MDEHPAEGGRAVLDSAHAGLLSLIYSVGKDLCSN